MGATARRLVFDPEADQIVSLRVDWKTFETVLAARRDASVPRISYLDGMLELMSPSKTHESVAALIGRLVEEWAGAQGVVIEATGGWTLKNKLKDAGLEPDKSWVIGERPDAKRPDLAVEMVHTHGGLDKLEIYARLGVREVWFWIDGKLTVHVLRGAKYVAAARSHVFKTLDLQLLIRFAKHPSPGRAPLLYRAALQRER